MLECLREGNVIVRTIARIKDREGDDGEVRNTLRDFLAVDSRHAVSRIPEGTTAERAENDMADSMLAQRVKLRCDSPSGFLRFEAGTVPKVDGRGTKLKEWENLVVRQPGIPKIRPRSILGSTNANARAMYVQIDAAVPGGKEPCHRRPVAVQTAVIFVFPNLEMGIAPSEQVLFLSDRTLYIRTAWHVSVGHVQYRETRSMCAGKRLCHLTPVPRKYLDEVAWLPNMTFGMPTGEIPDGEAMKSIGRIGFIPYRDRFAQDLTPAGAVRATKPSAYRLLLRAKLASRHDSTLYIKDRTSGLRL